MVPVFVPNFHGIASMVACHQRDMDFWKDLKKRLKKARLIDKSRGYILELKEVEKEMVKRGCSVESVSKLRDVITILKQIAK